MDCCISRGVGVREARIRGGVDSRRLVSGQRGWGRGVGVGGVRVRGVGVRRGWGSWGGAGRVGARGVVVCGGWGGVRGVGVEVRRIGVGVRELGWGFWRWGLELKGLGSEEWGFGVWDWSHRSGVEVEGLGSGGCQNSNYSNQNYAQIWQNFRLP